MFVPVGSLERDIICLVLNQFCILRVWVHLALLIRILVISDHSRHLCISNIFKIILKYLHIYIYIYIYIYFRLLRHVAILIDKFLGSTHCMIQVKMRPCAVKFQELWIC